LVLLIASRAIVAESVNLSDLPLQGTRERPLIVLELGRTPPATTAKKVTTKVAIAKLTAHEGDESVRIGDGDLTTLHKGFSTWSSTFQFDLGMRWHPVLQEPTLTVPLSGFRAYFGARAPGRARGAELHAVLQLIDTRRALRPTGEGNLGRAMLRQRPR